MGGQAVDYLQDLNAHARFSPGPDGGHALTAGPVTAPAGYGRSMPVQVRPARRPLLLIAALIVITLLLGFGVTRLASSRSTQLAGKLVQRVVTEERVVALTFDDGPTAADIDAVLGALAERNVSATFYLNGKDIDASPEALRRIVDAGHEIGNHTWSHRRMVFVSPGTVAEEVESTDAAIRASGYTGPITFRPPYGQKLLTLPLYLAEHDRLTVTWDVSAEDWSGEVQTSADIVERTVTNTRPGSIILLHPWFGRTVVQESIGPIIDQLQNEGYRFVTVSELVG